MGFFDWLAQLRMTPTYSVLIAAIFTPIITGLVAYFTIRNQRGLASRDRSEKRYEKLLDALAAIQPLIVPAHMAVFSFSEAVWGWESFKRDDAKQQVIDKAAGTRNAVAAVMHELAVVSLRTQKSDEDLRRIVSSAFEKCHRIIEMVDEFSANAHIDITSAVGNAGQPHERLRMKMSGLLGDIDRMINEARQSDPS